MATKYDYSLTTDFPNHIVSLDRLAQEITTSAIVTALDHIDQEGNTVSIWFKATLSGGDQTILNGIVAAHSGAALPNTALPVMVTGSSTVSLSRPITGGNTIHKFGNMNLTSSLEFTVAARPYVEPKGQNQRSVISTSTSDVSPGGSGARKVRIVYLDSNYIQRQEDVALAGTAGVNTVATDIRFIEDFYVIEGTNAVGSITLASGVLGTGSAICQIGSATTQAFLCHHYVPSGSRCYVLGWGATTDRDTNMRLRSQIRSGSFLVDTVTDLDKMYGLTGLFNRMSFDRKINGVVLDPQTYVRVTVQPSGTYSSTVRCYLDLWEEPIA